MSPILSLGFRPFYLLACLFAVIAMPLWLGLYLGGIQPFGTVMGMSWHSHEMVFGFTSAVIAGFLLTAVRNWTGQPTATGTALALLAVLWILGRVWMAMGPSGWTVLVDGAFVPVLMASLAVPIWRSRNVRNYPVLLVLLLLATANLLWHLSHLDLIPIHFGRTAQLAALNVVTVLMAIIGGRVIPVFTRNAVPGSAPRHSALLERVSMVALLALVVLELVQTMVQVPVWSRAALYGAAAATQLLRWLLWQPWSTRRQPLLWMLPVAYLWIPVSLALHGLAAAGWVGEVIAVHALTLGAMSGLMLAMMIRSSLGHTGRPLIAGFWDISAFVSVQAAALGRLVSGWLPPEHYRVWVLASGLLWTLGFAVCLCRLLPMLTRPRIDGKPG